MVITSAHWDPSSRKVTKAVSAAVSQAGLKDTQTLAQGDGDQWDPELDPSPGPDLEGEVSYLQFVTWGGS